MKTTNHTPGPWAIETVKRTIGDSKETYDSLCVTFASPLRAKLICELGADTLPDNPQNAHLISAAPDLLSAVDSCLEIMIRAIGERLPINKGTECEETDWLAAIRKARAAIAKAEGVA